MAAMSAFEIKTLSAEIASGKRSAEDVTRECIRRIERDNGRLHAVIAVDPDAIDQARKLDRECAEHGTCGPLHGVPLLVKDNIETAGRLPTTAGSLALADNVTGRDAHVVAQLRAAGAVILGKANLSEWANFRSTMSVSGWSAVGGQTVNAHDPTRSPCGSSSGSAVAVAARMVPAAIGTETDGSIVCPASINGIVGLKPTVGLVSRSGVVPIAGSQDTAGPMANTVADCALLLSAMTANDEGDPGMLVASGHHGRNYFGFIEQADREPGLEKFRLGVVKGIGRFHPECDALLAAAVDRLRALGATIVPDLELKLPDGYREASFQVLLYEFKQGIDAYLRTLPSTPHLDLDALIRFNRERAKDEMAYFGQDIFDQAAGKRASDGEAYGKAALFVQEATRRDGIDRLIGEHQLSALVGITSGPAWSIDTVNGDRNVGSCSTFAAVAGYPHITLPMGSVRGLPIGLSIYGRAFAEPALFGIAHRFERSR